MFCQNCGADISNSGAKFCGSCGTELNSITSTNILVLVGSFLPILYKVKEDRSAGSSQK